MFLTVNLASACRCSCPVILCLRAHNFKLEDFFRSQLCMYTNNKQNPETKQVVPVRKNHTVKAHIRSWGAAVRILNLSTRWIWVVSLTFQPRPPRKYRQYILGRPQCRSGRDGEETISVQISHHLPVIKIGRIIMCRKITFYWESNEAYTYALWEPYRLTENYSGWFL